MAVQSTSVVLKIVHMYQATCPGNVSYLQITSLRKSNAVLEHSSWHSCCLSAVCDSCCTVCITRVANSYARWANWHLYCTHDSHCTPIRTLRELAQCCSAQGPCGICLASIRSLRSAAYACCWLLSSRTWPFVSRIQALHTYCVMHMHMKDD